jgi:hypothetical protein
MALAVLSGLPQFAVDDLALMIPGLVHPGRDRHRHVLVGDHRRVEPDRLDRLAQRGLIGPDRGR